MGALIVTMERGGVWRTESELSGVVGWDRGH